MTSFIASLRSTFDSLCAIAVLVEVRLTNAQAFFFYSVLTITAFLTALSLCP